jgi:hypothetical protein
MRKVHNMKEPLGMPIRGRMDNNKTDLSRDMMGWYGLDCSGSEWGQEECFCEQGNEPPGSKKVMGFF